MEEYYLQRRKKLNEGKDDCCQECFYAYHRCRCQGSTFRNTYRRKLVHEGDDKYCQVCYYLIRRCQCDEPTQVEPEVVEEKELFKNDCMRLVMQVYRK